MGLQQHPAVVLVSMLACVLWLAALFCGGSENAQASHTLPDYIDADADAREPHNGWAYLGLLLLFLCGPALQRFGLSEQGWEELNMHTLLSTLVLPAALLLSFSTVFCPSCFYQPLTTLQTAIFHLVLWPWIAFSIFLLGTWSLNIPLVDLAASHLLVKGAKEKLHACEPLSVDRIFFENDPELGFIGMSQCPGRARFGHRRNMADDLAVLSSNQVHCVVSLTRDLDLQRMGISDLSQQYRNHGLESLNLPLRDKWIPECRSDFTDMVDRVCERVINGRNVLVHCNGGKGRTGLLVACVLLRLGQAKTFKQALKKMRASRRGTLVNPLQQLYALLWLQHTRTNAFGSDSLANQFEVLLRRKLIGASASPAQLSADHARQLLGEHVDRSRTSSALSTPLPANLRWTGLSAQPMYIELCNMIMYTAISKRSPVPLQCITESMEAFTSPWTDSELFITECERLKTSWLTAYSYAQRARLVSSFVDRIGLTSLLRIFRLSRTTGSLDQFPPSEQTIRESFNTKHREGSRSELTVGARALAKHIHRASSQWWGDKVRGPEVERNATANLVLDRILDNATWQNMHQLPHDVYIYEVRCVDGYGARWSADGSSFRGFLEPHHPDGHEHGWKH